ncbi:MAG TPA: hypothetical protein VGN17_15295 [Bryobacteraceae bacterium]|jgi:hypothetical protein
MNLTKLFHLFGDRRSAIALTCLGLAAALAPAALAQGNLATGWAVRADSGAGADDKLMVEGSGFHIQTGGPPSNNGTFYNTAWTSKGNHTFSAMFMQNVKATHPDAYGLMIGGVDLDKDTQTYTYFEVRQAGEFYIATRKGASVTPVVPWTKNAAIKPEGADGKQMNTLEVKVDGANVIFSVNGTEVNRQPTSAVQTNGLFGFRVSHRLDITISDVKK